MGKRPLLNQIHRGIAVAVGVFILMWLITGIVMVSPPPFSEPSIQQMPALLDLQRFTVSPAETLASLKENSKTIPQVNSVSLKRIADSMVYKIDLRPKGSFLVDAQSGELFTITPDIAERIARHDFSSQSRILGVELVDRHNFAYPWGPLPVYRIVFDDEQGTVSYVSTSDGGVRRNDRWSRFWGAVKSLHTFDPLALVIERGAVRKGLLILLSIVGIGVAISGYALALTQLKR